MFQTMAAGNHMQQLEGLFFFFSLWQNHINAQLSGRPPRFVDWERPNSFALCGLPSHSSLFAWHSKESEDCLAVCFEATEFKCQGSVLTHLLKRSRKPIPTRRRDEHTGEGLSRNMCPVQRKSVGGILVFERARRVGSPS